MQRPRPDPGSAIGRTTRTKRLEPAAPVDQRCILKIFRNAVEIEGEKPDGEG